MLLFTGCTRLGEQPAITMSPFPAPSESAIVDSSVTVETKVPTATSNATPISSQKITVEGTYICLPHKNTNGPQTLECAFGIKTAQGNYGLRIDDPERLALEFEDNQRVRIEGYVAPDPTSRYDIVAMIQVVSAKNL